jgi:signal transduction histidine kinase
MTAAGVAAVAIIGALLLLHLRNVGIDHERREAERQTEFAAAAVVAPYLTPEVLRGDPKAVARLDGVIRAQVLRDPVARVKLWAPDGRIVYSDEPRLIGERFELEDDEREVLDSGGVTSGMSDLDRPENRFEDNEDRLLEVYTRVRGAGGAVGLFELYQRFEPLAEHGRQMWLEVLPALLGGLLLLELANIGIASWFTRTRRRTDQQRAVLLEKALDASNRERRRIAAELHDGVVQDLTAASLAVDGAARALGADAAETPPVEVLEEASETVRASVGTLRTLLMDFYPADLAARGLPAALGDLVALARARGLDAELEAPADFRPPIAVAAILFRVAQEAMRNAVTHSGARSLAVSVGADRRCYWVEIRDDGVGFDPEAPVAEGHFGMRAARELMADAGGQLTVRSAPHQGSVVRGELPHEETVRKISPS